MKFPNKTIILLIVAIFLLSTIVYAEPADIIVRGDDDSVISRLNMIDRIIQKFRYMFDYLQDQIDNLEEEIASIETEPGPEGPQGERGLPGEHGETGPEGPRGEVGPRGERGIPGEDGADGERGLQGERGLTGSQGEQGEIGPRGVQGLIGPPGEQGLRGLMGPQGPAGINGTDGAVGPQGERGLPGTSLWVVDAEGEEVGLVLNIEFDYNKVVVYELSLDLFLKFDLRSATRGTITAETPKEVRLLNGLYYESSDCSGIAYGIVNSHYSDDHINIYVPLLYEEQYYKAISMDDIIPRDEILFQSFFRTDSGICYVEDIRNTRTAVPIEEIELPTYTAPLTISRG
tara:strand:- start:271 stop:1305 length:1035 start_codon:yes stop_codon:yes gene_type:complete